MSLLSFVIVVTAVIFLLFAIDAYKRSKMNLLHFLVFGGGSVFIAGFIIKPELLTDFANIFGVAQGGLLVVYLAIIFLAYMYLQLVNKITKDNYHIGRLHTALALQNINIDGLKVKNLSLNNTSIGDTKIKKNKFMFMIKAYNEEKMIGTIIDEVIGAGFDKIICINDGSIDNTAQIIQDKISQYPNKLIILASHLINRRHGGGNKTGIEFFRRYGDQLDIDWVVFFDSDGQMDISDMDIFANTISQNPYIDIIQGSRFVEGGKASDIPRLRKYILFGAKLITYIFNGKASTDSHNGYKVFRLSALQKIKIFTDSTSYANELIDEYSRLDLKYIESPVHIRYTDYSTSGRGQSNSNSIKILLELIYKKLFFR